MILLKCKHTFFPYSQVTKNQIKFKSQLKTSQSVSWASSATESILNEFESIWKSGRTPERFNFSRDVFDRHAECRPSAPALWFEDDKDQKRLWSFMELQKESIRTAVFLKKVMNLTGSPVESPSKDSSLDQPFIISVLGRIPEWWFLHLAAIRVGTIFCPGTTMLSSKDLKYRLEASTAKLIITDEDNMSKVDEAVDSLGNSKVARNLRKVVVPKFPGRKVFPNDWIGFDTSDVGDTEVYSFRNKDTRSDQIAQAYFTSGSTGNPKMVPHSHASYGIGHYTTVRGLRLEETDLMWNISDPGWAKSSYSNFFAPWTAGACVYIHQMAKFEAKKVLKILSTRPVSVFCAPPTLYKSIIQEEDATLFKTDTLRHSMGAGEAVSPEVARVWKEKTGVTLHQGYGQTELTMTLCANSDKKGSIGIPDKTYYEIKILDAERNECPPNVEGEIALKVKPRRPIGLFEGYLRQGDNGPEMDKEKNASVFVGDYYLMGDQGFKDAEGNLFYVGRADDIISSAGYRIGPSEIEAVLQTHPAVAENAAVSSPDPSRGEVVKAFIVRSQAYINSDEEALTKEIQEYVKKHTAPYKYPRKVEFVDSLPKTVSGKILRRELKRTEFEKYRNSYTKP